MIDQKEIHRCLPSLVILSCLMHKLIWLVQDRLNIWSVQKSFQAQKSVGRKMWVSCVSVSRLNRGLRDYGDGAKECFLHLDLTEVNLQKMKILTFIPLTSALTFIIRFWITIKTNEGTFDLRFTNHLYGLTIKTIAKSSAIFRAKKLFTLIESDSLKAQKVYLESKKRELESRCLWIISLHWEVGKEINDEI